MMPLVEIPELVQHHAPYFEDVFSAGAFIQFQRYIIDVQINCKPIILL